MKKGFSLLLTLALASALVLGKAPVLAQATPGATPAPSSAVHRTQLAAKRSATGSSVSTQGTDIKYLVEFYAHRKHLNLYVDPSLPSRIVQFDVHNIPDDQAFQTMLKWNGMGMCKQNGITVVAQLVVLANRYHCIYLPTVPVPVPAGEDPAQLIQTLQALQPPGSVIWADTANHAIDVQGNDEAVSQVRSLIYGSPTIPERSVFGNFVKQSYALQYTTDPQKVVDRVLKMLPTQAPNALMALPENNTIVALGNPAYVAEALAMVQATDIPTSQVLYDVSFIEIEPQAYQKNQGILFGGAGANGQMQSGSGSTVYAFVNKFVPVVVTLNALENQGKAKLLERVSITTTNGHPGDTGYVTHIPVVIPDPLTGIGTLRTIDAGVSLVATPTIGASQIETVLQTSYSNEVGTGQGGYPILTERKADTDVITTNDDVILISGLYADTMQDAVQGLPPFDKIPIVGSIFRNKTVNDQHDEVVVLLQPHVVKNGNTHTLPVKFPVIPNDTLNHGIEPNPSVTPGGRL